jgi:hypothetical protein
VAGQNLADGGLVWLKNRTNSGSHYLFDTERGATNYISSAFASAQASNAQWLTNFNSNGFSLGTATDVNDIGTNYVAWSFLKKAGFMDIVEYEGDGEISQTINHNLESTVGMMLVKQLTDSGNWYVYHRSMGATVGGLLNSTSAWTAGGGVLWNNTDPTTTQFTVGNEEDVNGIGDDFIAYLFAHNPAQGSYCGSFTTDGSGNATITGLGFRPKLILSKRTDSAQDWSLQDSVRGFGNGLSPNKSDAEASESIITSVTSDGFTFNRSANADYIFWAAR